MDGFTGKNLFWHVLASASILRFLIMYYAVLLGLSKPNAGRIPVLEVWWPCRHVSPECSLDFLITKRGRLSTSKLQRKT